MLARVITLYFLDFLYVCRSTKAYEWGVEAMKLASKLKLDQQPCPPSVASHLLHQVDAFLSAADKISHSTALEDLNTLARKLDNPKLLDQCKVIRAIKSQSLFFFFRHQVNHFQVSWLPRAVAFMKSHLSSLSPLSWQPCIYQFTIVCIKKTSLDRAPRCSRKWIISKHLIGKIRDKNKFENSSE